MATSLSGETPYVAASSIFVTFAKRMMSHNVDESKISPTGWVDGYSQKNSVKNWFVSSGETRQIPDFGHHKERYKTWVCRRTTSRSIRLLIA